MKEIYKHNNNNKEHNHLWISSTYIAPTLHLLGFSTKWKSSRSNKAFEPTTRGGGETQRLVLLDPHKTSLKKQLITTQLHRNTLVIWDK